MYSFTLRRNLLPVALHLLMEPHEIYLLNDGMSTGTIISQVMFCQLYY